MVKVVFYGDDFTGATDNSAQYHRHGLKSLLFFCDPGEAALREAAARHDVIGVAGTARSMATDAMAHELAPIFQRLGQLGAPVMQYKCCSTFDSSPSVGSLGQAVQLMRARWPDSFVPVLAATPEFGRYTAFGHHFARLNHDVFRLDRHAVMARHPVTPMHESDLGRILEAQGFRPDRLVDLRELEQYAGRPEDLARALGGADSAVFDGFDQEQVATAAAAIWHLAQRRPVAAIAAQGFAHALGSYFRAQHLIDAPPPEHRLASVDQLLVLSGSCSSPSAAQIDWARRAGFADLRLTPRALADPASAESRALERELIEQLRRGRSVVAYSACGPDDPAIAELRELMGSDVSASLLADRIGALYARLMRQAIEQVGLRRFVVAGGDSSSFAMRHLGASALEIHASHFEQNAHVCRVHADERAVDGIEVLLKGGQVGSAELYGLMLDGF